DDQLRDRIRARLGHLVEHPGQLNVDVQNGFVVLRGHAAIDEIEELSTTLPTMHGVVGVDNRVLPEDRRTVL
ncbi:MAG TPA: BON domain-containing protein, partial [Xanthomonadaceae bacterium]|nr:BON domain-containing protein [Xanthomonadaceae bacterium]